MQICLCQKFPPPVINLFIWLEATQLAQWNIVLLIAPIRVFETHTCVIL